MISWALSATEQTDTFNGHLILPHHYDLFWGVVSFIVVSVLLWKFALPKFTAILDERTKKIEGGIKAAELAREEVASERAKMQDEIQEARRQAAQIREDATKSAAKTAQQLQNEAQAEASRMLQTASNQIDADKNAARLALRTEIGGLAVDIAGKILGESIADTQLHSRVIDRFLDELEADIKADQPTAHTKQQ